MQIFLLNFVAVAAFRLFESMQKKFRKIPTTKKMFYLNLQVGSMLVE